jgi:hypothetical protein
MKVNAKPEVKIVNNDFWNSLAMFRVEIVRVTILNPINIFMAILGRKTRIPISRIKVPIKIRITVRK